MTVNKDKLNKAETILKDFLKHIGIDAEVAVENDEENEAILISIEDAEESGLLIGNRGRTINSIQMIMSQMINRDEEEWERILVDIAGWRAKEERRLQELAMQTAERARATGEPQSLYNLSSAERRQVHMALSNEDDIETRSEGEGKERYLLIVPKE